MDSIEISEKSRGIALGLALTLGILGAHRFYVGKIGTGILMFLTGGGCGIWWVVDIVNIISGGFRDQSGERLLDWGFSDYESPRLTSPGLDEELDALNEDLDDVTARLERAERLLAAGARPPDPD